MRNGPTQFRLGTGSWSSLERKMRSRKGAKEDNTSGTKTETDKKKSSKGLTGSICTCFLINTGIVPVILVLVWLAFSRLGLGAPFPAQPEFEQSVPLLDESRLQVVVELEVPPGNLAVSKSGRVFFNFHPEVRCSTLRCRHNMEERLE
jgi:hypothetical protein